MKSITWKCSKCEKYDIEGRTNREKVAQFNALRKHEESCMGGNQDKKEKLMS